MTYRAEIVLFEELRFDFWEESVNILVNRPVLYQGEIIVSQMYERNTQLPYDINEPEMHHKRILQFKQLIREKLAVIDHLQDMM